MKLYTDKALILIFLSALIIFISFAPFYGALDEAADVLNFVSLKNVFLLIFSRFGVIIISVLIFFIVKKIVF